MSVEADIKRLHTWIDECRLGGLVFFGGAGVSTESGIPDFRSAGGIFMQSVHKTLSPEQIVSRSFFDHSPKEFYDFYVSKMIYVDAQPNQAHKKLAELEAQGILSAVVTQNIDGLHQCAGSKNVYELHGSVHRNFCMRCKKPYTLPEMLNVRKASSDGVPHCECGGIIKPDVVLYEESLDTKVLTGALRAIEQADVMVIAGTSLVVNPAASLVNYFNGSHLAIVNLSPTHADKQADLCISAKVGEVFNL